MKIACKCRLRFLSGVIATLIAVLIFHLVIAAPFAKEFNKQSNYYKSLELGGEWFLNNQNVDFLYYTYYPYKNKYDIRKHALREMGALWSIGKLANFLNDQRYGELAQKGFGYFEKSFVYNEEKDFIYVNVESSKIKLGYSAFAILSLIEIDHPQKNDLLEKLANGILYLQQDSGELKTFFFSERITGQDYYPGEALLALMSLYEYSGDTRYLDAVQKAFPFYRDYFRSNPNTAFVPWQSRAYYKLYQATHNEEVADFIFEMNDYMLTQYNSKSKCSEFDFSAGSVVAVHAEGVNMAYESAKKSGDFERALCYENFSKETADYLISLQLSDETKYYKPAIGGFLGSVSSDSQRVDRNQHAVLMLMDALDFGILN